MAQLDIIAHCPMILKHYNPITEEGGVLVIQKLLHSKYGLNIVSQIATKMVASKEYRLVSQSQGSLSQLLQDEQCE